MATAPKTETGLPPRELLGESVLIQWGPLTQTDPDGAAVSNPEFSDMCVQVSGTFGPATLTMQGSNDLAAPTNWFTLKDAATGAAIAKTSAGGGVQGEQVLESPVWIRPLVSGADGSTSLTVKLKIRKGRGRAY